jgi:hypothetical protein
MTKLASSEPSMSAISEHDPLADARCEHCGYSLRGLPENRCPECGTAFDPEEIAKSFVAQWPRLLMWYLVIYVARAAFGLPYVWGRITYWSSGAVDRAQLASLAPSVAYVLRDLAAVILGPVAFWGLYRRRDWVRRVCIVTFAADCLYLLVRLVPMVGRVTTIPDLRFAVNTLLLAVSLGSICILRILLSLFLVTGLRPHSLIRTQDACPPRLLLRSFHPRHDWLLLMVLVLGGWGTAKLFEGVHQLSDFLGYQMTALQVSMGKAQVVYAALYYVGDIAVGISALVAAVRIWRKPESLRAMLATVAALAVASRPLLYIVAIVFNSPVAGIPAATVAAMLLRASAGTPLLALTLLLFALLGLSRTDIDNLAAAVEGSKS